MKKLLTSIVAGAALLFGFASCSGNLQDNKPEDFPLYIVGDIALDKDGKGTRLPFAFEKFDEKGNEILSYTFTYDAAKMNAWGGGKGTANFKIVATSDPNDWSKDWGGEKDKPVNGVVIQDNTKSDTNTYVKLNMRDGNNSNPGNIVVKDLADKSTYKVVLKYNRASDSVEVKLEGTVTYIPKFYIIQSGKDPIEMSRNGSVYAWEFKAEKDGTVKFLVRQDDNEWYAYSTEDEVAAAAKMVFKTVDNIEEMTLSCKKDLEYKVSVNASDISAITISGGLNNILGSAGITGFNNGWGVGEPLTITGKDTAEFAFEGALDSIEFAIQEVAGTWNPRWFAGIPEGKEKPKTDKLMGAITATKKNAVTDADYVEAIYYEADPGMDGSNIKVTGLPVVGSYKFKLLFKVVDADKKVVSIACVAQEDIPESAYSKVGYTDISGLMVAGAFNGWGTPFTPNLTKVSDHVYTCEVTGTGDDLEFGLIAEGWAPKYTGAVLTAPKELNKESEAVTLTKNAAANNKITKTTFDAKYILTFTANNDWSISCTVKQTTAGGVKPAFSIDGWVASGNFNEWGNTAVTKISETVSTVEITAAAETVEFALHPSTGWSPKFTGAIVAVGGEAQTLTKGADDNAKITGCTAGSKYKITFTITDAANEVVTASVAAVE